MTIRIIHGDSRDLSSLADRSVHCCATSPPYYGLRSYLANGDPRKALEIGSESTPDQYVGALVAVFREVRRVLRDDGTLWLNLGDCYADDSKWGGSSGGKHVAALHGKSGVGRERRDTGLPGKNLLLMPYRVAMGLQADGWVLRAAVPWVKTNPMPESATDRPTTAHETIFLFAKSERYFVDPDAVRVAMVSGANGSMFTNGKTALDGVRRNVGQGPRHEHVGGRNIRTSDFFDAGLDSYQRRLAEQAEHVAHVRAKGGMLLAENGDPLAFMVNTAPSAYKHYAMWPPDLVKPMIMFSTSEPGVCAGCGAPLRRGVARSEPGPQWQSTCSCAAATVPATVLDPFGGTGTTARVAEDLGRNSVIVELDANSVAIAQERTAQAGLFASGGAR